ncbi:cysteine desulfurase sulfur acceptor subunit CsdE [Musicola paradisiaca]|uniref:Cysteine desulfurase, sulfur acceptor subunit CsdE n=1 Tax=Musicola paradisiaca (strain Ech703) TaxID=579405 RepID=C6CC12_MUSP7|nr:cysteine desulfurase sulfur acceptor subunit CsdE [Musicola paradisiaca]ACS86772.1 cysteine desulfurase, sulfur acceptor subunit CsdE [Musicola paradisiaca Ech703]
MTTHTPQHPFGTAVDENSLLERFAACRSWEERYRQIILLAKTLPTLADEYRQEQIALSGCENRVWLGYERRTDGTLHFYGDSDGRIVRGLLAILLTSVEGKTAAELRQMNPLALFERLALKQQLSASRAGGLAALAARVRDIAGQED